MALILNDDWLVEEELTTTANCLLAT